MEYDFQVRQLMRLGLTTYEARVYLALLGRGAFSASEVARHAQVPRQRIYDVLESLVAKGLASNRPGAVTHYTAADPEGALGRLVAAQRRQVEETELQTAAMIDELAPLYRAGQSHTDPLNYIEILRDRGAISARFDELQSGVEEEILVLNKPPYAKAPQENVQGLSVARSHVARGLYEFSLFDDLAATEGVRRFMLEGEEVRFVPLLPLKLVILDENIVMFGMQDPVGDGSDLTIVVVEHASLASVLKTAFNAYWEAGLTFDQAYTLVVQRRTSSA